jgi:hypothetical protein
VSKKKKQPAPTNGRLSWDGRLWDRKGDEWTNAHEEIERPEVEELLRRGNVEVAIAECGGPLRWLEEGERIDVWRREIAPDFHDVPNWKPPRDAPGQWPYSARIWRRGDATLILFDC